MSLFCKENQLEIIYFINNKIKIYRNLLLKNNFFICKILLGQYNQKLQAEALVGSFFVAESFFGFLLLKVQ